MLDCVAVLLCDLCGRLLGRTEKRGGKEEMVEEEKGTEAER